MPMMNGRICVFDLSSGESSEEPLENSFVVAKGLSTEVARHISSAHGGGCLVLGSGILTGSPMPAACAGFVWCERGVAPVLGHAGLELKLSGFDFVVIKGVSDEPGYLWVRDGMAEFVPSPGLKGRDTWARTDKVRDDQGDRRIHVLAAGPWGDAGLACSQLVCDHWGGEDKAGLAAELGRRNLVAVAFKGMGEIAVSEPAAHFESCVSLHSETRAKLGASSGIASYFGGADREDFRAITHRPLGCYGCPYPCRTFVKVREDPRQMALVEKEPGYLHYDIPALRLCFSLGLDSRGATDVLTACARAGAEPIAVLSHCASASGTVDPGAVSRLLESPTELGPPPADRLAGEVMRSFDDDAMDRAVLGLGLCPRFWSKAGLGHESLSACIVTALGTGVPIR